MTPSHRTASLIAALLAVPALAHAGDFNGDGFADVVIGAPHLGGVGIGGAVFAIPGSATGLASQSAQILTGGQFGLSEIGLFGETIAFGDFDGDGTDDLAIGAPFAVVNGVNAAGAVIVVPGSASGLKTEKFKRWSQNTKGVKEKIDEFKSNGTSITERFGSSLVTGDFDGDGFADLAIGSGEFVGKKTFAGGVNVLYGSTKGLSAAHDQMWTQNSHGVKEKAEKDERFGRTLAAADLNGDGCDDLVVGTETETIGDDFIGVVQVLYGGPKGLRANGDELLEPPNLDSDQLTLAEFGQGLTVGDFDADGTLDLVVGNPIENPGGPLHGSLWTYRGDATGLVTASPTQTTQESLGIPVSTAGDFAGTLAAADFDGDGHDDLALGFRFANIGAESSAGAVWVVTASTLQFWSQDASGIVGIAGATELFGSSLATTDVNGDGAPDLLVGAPQDQNDTDAGGVVHCIFATPQVGLTSQADEIVGVDTFAPIPGAITLAVRFGSTIAK